MSDSENKSRIIKVGDDLIKVDGRNRPIGKVSMAEAQEFIGPEDLKKSLEEYVSKEELLKQGLATKEDLTKYKPDLGKFVSKDEVNVRFALKTELNQYTKTHEVDEKIKAQSFSNLVRKSDMIDYVKKSDLDGMVTREELAKIISPALLAKLVTKAELEASYCKKDCLKSLATKDEVILKSAESQAIHGEVKVVGKLYCNDSLVKVASKKERSSTRIVESGPAKLTLDDDYVIIMNNTDNLFGAIVPKGEKDAEIVIKDGTGSAYKAPIKIVSASSETFDGLSEISIVEPYGSIRLKHNGKEWNIFK